MSAAQLRNDLFPKKNYPDVKLRPAIRETAFWVTARERLRREQYLVLKMYYRDDESWASISRQMGIEPERVHRYMAQAKKKMMELQAHWADIPTPKAKEVPETEAPEEDA